MNYSIKNKLFVLAFCITNSFCFGQQNRSVVCRLGELTNDSLLPYIQRLEVDSTADIKTYIKKSEQLTSLNQIELKGAVSKNDWELFFNALKTQKEIKTIIFNANSFASLPYGYEGLYSIENISFKNNDELDYAALFNQLSMLPNIKELSLEVVTIFELPNNINQLKNIETLRIINTDESISQNDPTLLSLEKEPVTYDYTVKNENNKPVVIKYTAMAGEIDGDEYKELAKRFTTTGNYMTSTMAFVPKYVNVDPPIKGIDVERTSYLINPQIENIITYPSGTRILIPANAFISKNGDSVKSSVTLNYREFRDPVDFLVSGIPMKYDTGGTITNFESAGMFELTAAANSEEIKLAPDKKIDMNFASTSKDSTYNFYAFNDKTGNWEYLSKPQPVTNQTIIKLKAPTIAFQLYRSYSNYNKRVYDSTLFANRFTDTNYVYTHIKHRGNNRITYRSEGKRKEKSVYALVKLKNIKKAKDGTVLFKVDYISTSHPEMAEFNSLYFASNENLTPAAFKQKYGKRKYYNDVRVVFSGGDVSLELKDNSSVKNISANLVTLSPKGEVTEVKNSNTLMKRYNKRLKNRERIFNKDIAKGRLDDNTIEPGNTQQLKMYAYGIAKKKMDKNERKMSFNEWEAYCKQTEENERAYIKQVNAEQLAKLGKAEATADNLIQSLSLEGMGIYNCDQIQRMQKPVEIFASYKTPENKKINAKSAYVIDRNNNSVFQYDGYAGFSAGKIAFDQSETSINTLLEINKDGSIAVYKTEDFKKNEFKNKSHFDFAVTPINSTFTTVNELKTLIGF